MAYDLIVVGLGTRYGRFMSPAIESLIIKKLSKFFDDKGQKATLLMALESFLSRKDI